MVLQNLQCNEKVGIKHQKSPELPKKVPWRGSYACPGSSSRNCVPAHSKIKNIARMTAMKPTTQKVANVNIPPAIQRRFISVPPGNIHLIKLIPAFSRLRSAGRKRKNYSPRVQALRAGYIFSFLLPCFSCSLRNPLAQI